MHASDTNLDLAASGSDTDHDLAMRDARQRFMATFPKRSDSIGLLLGMVSTLGKEGPLDPLRDIVHRTAGLAGTLGFPLVSKYAIELDTLLDAVEAGTFDHDAANRAFDLLQAAFADDLASPPDWAITHRPSADAPRILVVEDDEDQREVVGIQLRAAGYTPIPVSTGDAALAEARHHRPHLVLLDANLPGMDGYAVCRALKADPDLAGTPVVFMTVRAHIDDKTVGLMLGADDYLTKPVDMAELVLRIRVRLQRRAEQAAAEAHAAASAVSAAAAAPETLEAPEAQVEAGALAPAEAHATQAAPGAPGAGAAVRGKVVVADDDPEVTRLVEAQLRSAGYEVTLASDGTQAVDAIDRHRPDVLIVDMMMPRMTGFDVLMTLQRQPGRPRIIVLSARGRDEDVTRAFALGADDYVTKPFSPTELLGRVERLLR